MAEKNKEEVKVLSIAEQEALAKEEVQKVLKLAKDKGRVTIEAGNALAAPATLREGEFALLFYGTDHRLSLPGDTRSGPAHVMRHE